MPTEVTPSQHNWGDSFSSLGPAGVAGEAINLALGDLALSDHNQIHVTVGGKSRLAGA